MIHFRICFNSVRYQFSGVERWAFQPPLCFDFSGCSFRPPSKRPLAANRKGMSIAKRVSMVSKWDAVIWCASMDIGTAHLASSRSVWSRLICLVDECTSKEFRFHGDVVSNANQYSKVHIFTALISLTLMAPSLNKMSLSNNSFVHYKLFTPTHLPIVSCPKYTVYYPKTMDSERLIYLKLEAKVVFHVKNPCCCFLFVQSKLRWNCQEGKRQRITYFCPECQPRRPSKTTERVPVQRRHRHEIKVTLKPCHCGLPPAVLQVPRLDFQFEKPRVAVDQCFTTVINGKMG